MDIFLKWFGISWVFMITGAALISIFGPREDGTLDYLFVPDPIDADVVAAFVTADTRLTDLTPGVEKRIIWAGEEGARTPLSLVYVHGFSATSEELRPVPDQIAKALGANLVFTRLTGHGRSGDALAEARVRDWTLDTAEAIEVARQVGDEVIVMGTSTGATLLAGAIVRAPILTDDIKAAIFVSPNFGIKEPTAFLLDWAMARYWIGWIVGERLQFESINQDHATYWTRDYPTTALLPMSALVQSVLALDFELALVDALFWYSPDDQVVDAEKTERMAYAWERGFATATLMHPTLTDEDDPFRHVVAGEIFSPSQTDATVSAMLEWLEGFD